MFLGRVVGNVWTTIKWPQIQGLKLLTVQPYHLSDLCDQRQGGESCHDLVVCADVLGAGIGEDVIIAYGHAARVALHQSLGAAEQTAYPIDAAVVAIVDQLQIDRAAVTEAAVQGAEAAPTD